MLLTMLARVLGRRFLVAWGLFKIGQYVYNRHALTRAAADRASGTPSANASMKNVTPKGPRTNSAATMG